MIHTGSFGLLSVLGIIGLFNSTPSSAQSFIKAQVSTETNSQRIELLSADFGPEIPKAIGGPEDIFVNEKLALLSPQIGIATGDTLIQQIKIDPSGIITYVVQKGDTLSEIAEKFDVSVNTIRWENNLGKTLKVGKELNILPVTGVRHTIKKGDTFASIAKTYDVEVEDIIIFNNIADTELSIDKKIIIPNGVKPAAKVSKTSSTKASATLAKLSTSSGEYITPTAGMITSKMGSRNGRYHYGIDYGASTGTPIVATRSGRVIKTTCGSGYGKCLVIKHDNGTQSLYAHASKLFVSTGTNVKQGQKIAAVGSTGRSTGPHLHFEIRNSKTGQALNPLSLIK